MSKEGFEGFRQYGQMKQQRWEESETRREEERISEKIREEKEKAKGQKQGARKGRKVAKHCVVSND